MSEKDFDLICIGRSCVDLYSGEFGVPLERAMTFTKSVGGSPMNIAIGTSRLGLRVGAITGVGQEDNGRYLKWQLSCEGVDVSAVKTDPQRLTAMVLPEHPGRQRPAHPVRENCADMGLTAEDIDPDYLARARTLVTGTHLSREGVRSMTMKVLKPRSASASSASSTSTSAPTWGLRGTTPGPAAGPGVRAGDLRIQKVLPYFDLIVGTEEEFFIAGGKTEAMEACAKSQALEGAPRLQARGQGCAALPGDIRTLRG
ncbi:MAG: PfkB family carbohydrate kinase [Bilophila wadsworthia]